MPRALIIAGANGAGKTTFARTHLPRDGDSLNFVNADLIAAGLSPLQPEAASVAAGRLLLQRIAAHVRRRESFTVESTLSGRMYIRRIAEWKRAGYSVDLVFIRLASADLAIRRVKARVRQGGHHVADDTIRRRFALGLANFENLYKPLVDHWRLFDNSEVAPVLIDEAKSQMNRHSSRHPSPIALRELRSLRQAARHALALARQTGTPCWVIRDGKMVDLAADGTGPATSRRKKKQSAVSRVRKRKS